MAHLSPARLVSNPSTTEQREAGVFTRIVVGTDGSETAAEAVHQAIDLARLFGAELRIVSAYAPVSGRRVQSEQLEAPADVQHEIGPREDVNLVLEAAAAEARKGGIEEVQTHPVEADPADAILNVAEQTDADLIVVGNKGMTGARRYLLGSVPNNISHHAPCSVIIVRTT
jgi:nucleotide-binding universal stress UspA family protein